MSAHSPKQNALEALVANRLSEHGKRRLEAHVAFCGVCQSSLDSIREYSEMLDAAREEDTPELSWEAFEKRLGGSQTAKALELRAARPNSGKWIALAWPVLAVAATFAIAWVGISGQRREEQLAKAPNKQPVVVAPKVVEPVPTLSGEVLALSSSLAASGRALSLGAEIHEGDVLHTGPGEELHVKLSDATGIVLWQNSDLVVSHLRADDVEFSLSRGGLSNVVKKLADDARFVVRAGKHAAEVRGTRFSVERDAEVIRVGVHEGRVVVSEDGRTIAELSAGQHWSNEEGAKLADDRSVIGLLAAKDAVAQLKLPTLPNVAFWKFEEARFAAKSDVLMRAPVGDVALAFEDLKGQSHAFTFKLAPEGGGIDEETISEIIERDRESRVGVLEPEQIQPVVKAGIKSLTRCYEQALRREPTLAGKVVLGVRVSSQGTVVRATLESQLGQPVAPDLAACITNQASAWVFPKPKGGPVFFEVPLNLKAAQGR